MSSLSDTRLLEIWESGARRQPSERALALLAAARPDVDAGSLLDLSIGERDASILALRSMVFGDRIPCFVDCPACTERLEFEFDASLFPAPVEPGRALVLENGLEFRLPNVRDLAAIAGEAGLEDAARALVRRCCVNPEDVSEWSSLLVDEVERQFASLEGTGDVRLNLSCVTCGHAWFDSLDVAVCFWEQLEARAEELLDDVHALAGAYGWSEADILAMSRARREAYLSRCDP